MKQYYRIDVYVPTTQAAKIKNAMFDAGAGRLGKHTKCCWEFSGRSQFHVGGGEGLAGNTRVSEELKLEMIVAADQLQAVVDAMLDNHPSEEPMFCYFPVGILFPPPDDQDDPE